MKTYMLFLLLIISLTSCKQEYKVKCIVYKDNISANCTNITSAFSNSEAININKQAAWQSDIIDSIKIISCEKSPY